MGMGSDSLLEPASSVHLRNFHVGVIFQPQRLLLAQEFKHATTDYIWSLAAGSRNKFKRVPDSFLKLGGQEAIPHFILL